MEVNVKEARTKISSLLDRTENGEDIVIIRRGKRVARLVAVGNACKRLPDLRRFRDSISVKGESLNAIVIQGRKEERY
ncbi:MAG: type II toxin-antitoxin system prevent-host-death family antitoxin [Desulfobacterales bacterium]